MQINLIFTDKYPAMSKSPKQVPDCLKIVETSVVLVCFNCVFCEVHAVTVSYRSSYMNLKSYIFGQWPLCSQCNLTAQIEPVQDKGNLAS